jgi:hypothetical protein
MPRNSGQLRTEPLVTHSVWNDDICNKVWKHLVTDTQYEWLWKSSTTIKFREITGANADEITNCSRSDLDSAQRLRRLVGKILAGDDERRANELAIWIVTHWGGIKRGKDKIPEWMASLRPFDSDRVSNFIRSQGTKRISSWSKILSFFDCQRHAVYDARTAIAINSAMKIADLSPAFHIPASQNRALKKVIPILKEKYNDLSFGYSEYIILLNRFVEIGKAKSILEAERALFAGAEATAFEMMKKVKAVD